MAVISLNGAKRETLGKGGARKARAAGRIPAVLYGHGETPVSLSVNQRDFQVALHHHLGGNAIVSLAIDGGEHTALLRDVQYDPISHVILHLDFQHISLTEMVEVSVATHLVGLPIGVKDGGGILEHILREVDVRCLPTVIPAKLDVDVSALNIGDSVHVRDIVVADVTILTDPDDTIATVVPPTVVEETAATGETAAAAEGEPEVIAKGKKDDDEGKDDKKEKDKKEK
jgi:large subunit ribosomal protein L25